MPDGRFSLNETRYYADGARKQERVTPCAGCSTMEGFYRRDEVDLLQLCETSF